MNKFQTDLDAEKRALRSHEDDIEALSIAPATGGYCIYVHTGIGYLLNDYMVKTKDEDDILMRAIELNATFGIQLSYKDKKNHAVNITKRKLEKNEDITEIRKRLVKVLSVIDDTYNKWTKNIREEYDSQIQSQIIQEYLKAELTQEQIGEKFGVDHKTVSNYADVLGKKINLLFFPKPSELFKSLPENIQNKFFKEYRTDEEKDSKSKKHIEKIDFDTFYQRLKDEYKDLSEFKVKPYNIWSYGKQDADALGAHLFRSPVCQAASGNILSVSSHGLC